MTFSNVGEVGGPTQNLPIGSSVAVALYSAKFGETL